MEKYGELTIIPADGKPQRVMLTKELITLGRDPDSDIVFTDRKTAAHHAVIECSKEACFLVALDTTTGTFVDGRRVRRVMLIPGSVIKLGDNTLRFEAEAPPNTDRTVFTTLGTTDSQVNAPRRPGTGRLRSSSKKQTARLISNFFSHIQETRPDTTELPTIPANAAEARLPRLVVHLPDRTWELPLSKQEVWMIGRNPDNDIPIDHLKVSRRHARIEKRNDHTFIIQDLNSTNGTWFERQRIGTHALKHTQTIEIGPAKLVFKDLTMADSMQRVRRPQFQPTPVVVIPGNFGSSLWRGSEQLWPNIRNLLRLPERFHWPDSGESLETRGIIGDTLVVPDLLKVESYQKIGERLINELGYTRGKDLLEFAYDWRLDLRDAARRLAQAVEYWMPDQQVTVISHNLGCLVGRYYIDRLGGHTKVRQHIAIGGPNYGAPMALVGLLPHQLNHLLPEEDSINEQISQMFSTFPSIYQWLPAYDCVFDQEGKPINVHQGGPWLDKDKQPLLRMAREFHTELSAYAMVPTLSIFGFGVKTISTIQVARQGRDNWERIDLQVSPDGDGQVPTSSAILRGSEIHPVLPSQAALYLESEVLNRVTLELLYNTAHTP